MEWIGASNIKAEMQPYGLNFQMNTSRRVVDAEKEQDADKKLLLRQQT